MIEYFSADNNSKAHVSLQVPLTEDDISPKSNHFNLAGNRGNEFYSNNE
jgi:hypothetical protein